MTEAPFYAKRCGRLILSINPVAFLCVFVPLRCTKRFLSAFVSLPLKARHIFCFIRFFSEVALENDLFVNESLSKMTERALRGAGWSDDQV
jgi:hypothetical protein